MTRTIARIVLGLFCISVLYGCGEKTSPSPAKDETTAASGERTIKYWTAPMDPTFIADAPGKSPMGMDLIPVYENDAPGGDSSAVVIDPAVVQNMGVRTAPVQRRSIFRHVRTIGEIEVAEDLVSVVNLRFSGWVEKLYADKTGDPIEKGERLFDIYSPGLVAAQEEFLVALRTQGPDSHLARSSRRKLELWNLSPADIDKIAREKRARRVLPIRAPRSGFILEKTIVEGARVEEGVDLYQIGDLTKIWVTAEIYETDAPWIEIGQPAEIELTHGPGKVIQGTVAYVYPTLESSSRTLKVRLEFDNPDYRMKPGMFATVYIQFQRRDNALVIPTEAILHSGTRQIVFITRNLGHFEPREITTGLVGDRHDTEVLSGLAEGELIVVSGQFLIDSESQLQEAIRKMLKRRNTPAGSSSAASQGATKSIWSGPMHPEIISTDPGRCPICGMDLESRPATKEELERLGIAPGEALHSDHEFHPENPTSGPSQKGGASNGSSVPMPEMHGMEEAS